MDGDGMSTLEGRCTYGISGEQNQKQEMVAFEQVKVAATAKLLRPPVNCYSASSTLPASVAAVVAIRTAPVCLFDIQLKLSGLFQQVEIHIAKVSLHNGK